MAAAVRGLLGFWVGGASAPQANAGVRSMLAFWMGGASPGPYVRPPVDEIPVNPAGRPRFAIKRPKNEDEELFLIITAALHVLDS